MKQAVLLVICLPGKIGSFLECGSSSVWWGWLVSIIWALDPSQSSIISLSPSLSLIQSLVISLMDYETNSDRVFYSNHISFLRSAHVLKASVSQALF